MITTQGRFAVIDQMNEQAWTAVRAEPAASIELAEKALAESESKGYKAGAAWAKSIIGFGHTWLGNFETSMKFNLEATEMLRDCGEYSKAIHTYYNLAVLYHFIGDFDKQLYYCEQSLQLATETGDKLGIANALNGFGTTYYTEGDAENALKYLDRALEAALETGDKGALSRIYDGIGQCHILRKNYAEAIAFKNKVLDVQGENGQPNVLSYAHEGLGEIYSVLGDMENSLSHFRKSHQLRGGTGFKPGLGQTTVKIANLYLKMGNYDEALRYFKSGLLLGEDIESEELIYKSHLGLSEVYENQDNLTLFARHFRAYHKALHEFNEVKESKKIKAVELKSEFERVRREKDELEQKNKELRQYFEDVRTLSRIGNEITSTLDIEAIFNIIYERINSLMNAQGIFIGIRNEQAQTLDVHLAIHQGQREKPFNYPLSGANRHLPVWVVKNATDVHINHYEKEIGNYLPGGEAFIRSLANSVVIIPLMVKERVTGVLLAESDQQNAFSQHHFNILKSFANYLAIAIDNASLYQEMESKIKERTAEVERAYKNSDTLNRIGQELISTLSFDDVFEKLYHNVNELMDATIFGVRLFDPERNVIEYRYGYERGQVLPAVDVSMDNDNNFSVWCIKHNKEIFVNDVKAEYKKYVSEYETVDGEAPTSFIIYPLRRGDEVLGLISVQSFEKNAYTEYHLSIVKTLAHYTTIALDNSRSYHLMEERVRERTEELRAQAEKIEQAYANTQLLSQIGKEISATLSSSDIIAKVYTSVNSLMDATIFGIAIHRPEFDDLYFSGAIERGEALSDFSYKLNEEKIATICFVQGREIVINDWNSEFQNFVSTDYEAAKGELPVSMIYLPLGSKDKITGVLTVQSFEINSYTDYHVTILRSLSLYVASALENASLYRDLEHRVTARTDELKQSYENTETLNKIGQELIATLNFADVFEHLYQNVNKLMDATVFGVRLLDEENQVVYYLYEYEKGRRLPRITIPLENKNNLSVWCIENDREIFADNIMKEATRYINQAPQVVEGEVTNSVIFYPLRSPSEKGKVIGVITVQSFNVAAYTEYHLNIVKTLAQYTVIAFENASRYERMESRVRSRTDEIQKSYENTKLLSAIGKDISAELNIESIIQKVYDSVNTLMSAAVFGIGIFRESEQDLYFSGTMEKGERLKPYAYGVNDGRIATICFNSGEEIVINDWMKEYQKYIKKTYGAVEGEMPESMIYLPLLSKGNKIGVITVQSFNTNEYTENHINILRTLSVYVASAIENARLYQGMEDRVAERTEQIEKAHHDTKLISQISKDIAESLNVETIVARVYENVNTLMDATCFGIGIHDAATKSLEFPGFIENNIKMEEFRFYLDDERLATWCFNNGKEVCINNYIEQYDKYIKGIKAPVQGKDSSSIIYIPLFLKDKKIGVLTVQSYDLDAYSDYHLDILRSLGTSIASAIDNARLYGNLEGEVRARTQEVVRQKEEIEKTYENTRLLSDIGKAITSQITVETIIDIAYTQINKLMDAEGFGVGVYNEKANSIDFPGYIEGGKRLPDGGYDLVRDKDRLSCVCFNNDQEMLITDLESEYQKYVPTYLKPVRGKACMSIIYLPIKSKNRKVGVVTVQSTESNAYTDYHFDIMKTIGVYIGIALENASLYATMEERVEDRTREIQKAHQDTKRVSEISKVIAESLNVETIIARVYESINSLMDATCFGIGIYDEDANVIRMPGFIEKGEKLEGVSFDASDENRLAAWCFRHRQEIRISDYYAQRDKYIRQQQTPIMGQTTESIIYLPLELKDKIIGVITVQSFEKLAYTDYHIDILRSLATTIASAIENALLYESLEDKVNQRTLELLRQKDIIEEKNKNITDSIIYAKRIQDATLPALDLVRSYLDKCFVLFRPKDIVSGDFYWVEKVDNTILFAVVDCTGHGVPGAFLSLIGYNALNQIVNELKILDPGMVLDALNLKVQQSLQNNLERNKVKDGMDMSICSLDMDTNILRFAGASNPMYLLRDGAIEVLAADKMAIGQQFEGKFHFETKVVQLKQGDTIYLFSDGYADQFGGPKGKKFKYSRFKELLLEIHNKKMDQQHDILCQTMDLWQGSLEQLDDLCVFGFKA